MKFTTVAVAAIMAIPALAAPVEERSCSSGTGEVVYDDVPGQYTKGGRGVNYGGNDWIHLQNQGYDLYKGTISYTGTANAEVRFEVPNAANTNAGYKPNRITIWSTLKSDRGLANVYCGKSLVGTLNEYTDGGETNSQVVFDKDVGDCELPKGSKPYIVVKSDRGAKYIAIDKLKATYKTA